MLAIRRGDDEVPIIMQITLYNIVNHSANQNAKVYYHQLRRSLDTYSQQFASSFLFAGHPSTRARTFAIGVRILFNWLRVQAMV